MTERGKSLRKPSDAEPADDETFAGPSPNPKTNLIVADVALRGGAALVRHGIERGLLGRAYGPDKARKIMKRRTLGESLASAAVSRLALGSVPGAILVGGGLLAKTLFDRRNEKKHRRIERETPDDAVEDDLSDDTYTGGY
ncbi:MAG: hypothetical protein KDE25_12890 [Novosphingobium sp.]|nr:hypothetical protein [Novosphingobium sp.]